MPIELKDAAKYVSSYIRELENAPAAINYAMENTRFVSSVVDAYGGLITLISGLSPTERSLMPATQHFKDKLGKNILPTPWRMLEDHLWLRRCPLANATLTLMMTKAEVNKRYPGSYPDNETIYFGTLVKTPQAYIVGLIGHVLERHIVATLPTEIGSPWEKDDFLHATNELVMFQEHKTRNCLLYPYFTHSHDNGGLNWVTPDYLTDFNHKLTTLKTD